MGEEVQTLQDDASNIYESTCKTVTSDNVVLFQNVTQLARADSLFYTDVLVNDSIPLRALLDSGSMACTISEVAESRLLDAGMSLDQCEMQANIMLIGCGGVRVTPKCIYQLKMRVYEYEVSVPTLVVTGQRDDLILGTNVLKFILSQFKQRPTYWRVVNRPESLSSSLMYFLVLTDGEVMRCLTSLARPNWFKLSRCCQGRSTWCGPSSLLQHLFRKVVQC